MKIAIATVGDALPSAPTLARIAKSLACCCGGRLINSPPLALHISRTLTLKWATQGLIAAVSPTASSKSKPALDSTYKIISDAAK